MVDDYDPVTMAMRMHQIQYERANRLEEENERLRVLLREVLEYAEHTIFCKGVAPLMKGCTCGLTELESRTDVALDNDGNEYNEIHPPNVSERNDESTHRKPKQK